MQSKGAGATLLVGLLAVAACGHDSDPPSGGAGGTQGPPGEMVDADLGKIPNVPVGGAAGGSQGSAGSSQTGGSTQTGGSSGQEVCAGTATSCSIVGAALCSNAKGCSLGGKCTGLSASCYSQLGSSQCVSQKGCYVSPSTNDCTGSPWSCSLFSGDSSCIHQKGCHWDDTCEGVSTPCSLIPVSSCTKQPGCYLETK